MADNDVDLSKLSDQDLRAIQSGDMSMVSDRGLNLMTGKAFNAKSSYEGVPPENLNVFQKLESSMQRSGLIPAGRELFSPKAVENKIEASKVIAPLGLGAAGAIAYGPAVGSTALSALSNPTVRKSLSLLGGGYVAKKLGIIKSLIE